MNDFSKYRIEMNNLSIDPSLARKLTVDPPGYSASLAKDSVSVTWIFTSIYIYYPKNISVFS